MFVEWPAPLPGGGVSGEMALTFDRGHERRLLVVPPLFEEHNKLRRQLIAIMRNLDRAGYDVVLPDLPGLNESGEPLERQTLTGWHHAINVAATHFGATHAFAIRSAALLLPERLPAVIHAPHKGAPLLRGMVRARTIAAREAGREERAADLLEMGRESGLDLAGWSLGPQMIRDLEKADCRILDTDRMIDPAEIGGAPLWLRAEPGEDASQAAALAGIIAAIMGSP
ncbi:hypothetical protein [Qipengyuania spongiae]|uniref:Alpha/beta hydrolase n=1 Tax=Qipengyuania spongiae TaxID=2909673 RepID=A0ABY5SWT4_9SPHN|nr:hypothetical protein [Qipengyuania spongiae]UVI38993.1 hypothetical protein L1F33_12245 [Qipengyuania spongiae]